MPSMARSRIPDLGEHLDDKSKVPENAIIFSISLLEEEICRMYKIIPCDVMTSRERVYKRRQPKGGNEFGVSSAVRAGKTLGCGDLVVNHCIYEVQCTLNLKSRVIRPYAGVLCKLEEDVGSNVALVT
ncbi:hypothetical protein AVEN_26601-1 [Araneus ventricosus]|uniref:Uncharacterized protein n=1 Tax=Araneus ventricosus TaxID=182803 RepID=A0A4Y2TCE1_ARAVE|nr:hypothetical protein AVEN_26601-1 [Araneus ventricosus]